MNQKPSDLYLGAIDFFGILIPGSILVFLHGDLFLRPFGLQVPMGDSLYDLILLFIISYVFGQFLLSFSVPLNRLGRRCQSETTKKYEEDVRNCMELPKEVSNGESENIYYSAFSFIRIHNASAIVEIERQAAAYKLFRSLTLLFLLDFLLTFFSGSFSLTRLVVPLLIVPLSAYRFIKLFDWTYRLVYDFYLQINECLIGKVTNQSLA
jgi:hypothetical protein